MSSNNITILLYGNLHEDISLIDTLNVYTKLCNVVLSVYKSDIDKVLEIRKLFPTIIIVANDITEYEKHPLKVNKQFVTWNTLHLQNGFFDICMIKLGLSVIHTKHVLVSRIDHYYSCLSKFIEYGLNAEKIVTSSIYVRGCKDRFFPFRFHFSNCLFMGKTNDIKLCFNLCYNNGLLTCPELGIWKPYFTHIFNIKSIDINTVNDEMYVEYVSELMDVYSINNVGPYKIKLDCGIKTHMNDNNKTTKEYLTYGCDC